MSALDKQVGGSHYKKLAIQPVEYIHANGLGYLEGNCIKYVTRWREKGGVQDLEKAKHYIELLIQMETHGIEKLAPRTPASVETHFAQDVPPQLVVAESLPIPPPPENDE